MNIVNIWAVIVSAIASMVIGSVWYGPLFGKMFMKEMGMDQWSAEKQAAMKKDMMLTYLWQFIASLVMFYVLGRLMFEVNHLSVVGGLKTSFLAWLGFVVPLALGNALWGGKMKLFWLSIGNMLITLLVAGMIIGAWH
jgi:hypothetical protein